MRVVFVHGACVRDGAWWWHRTAELLQARGVASSAPALPSCGEAGRSAGAQGPGLSDDVAEVRQLLQSGSEPTVMVVHSYGGIVAAEAAAGTDTVQHLLLISSYLPEAGQSLSSFGDGTQAPFLDVDAEDGTGDRVPRHVPRAILRTLAHTLGQANPQVGRQVRASLAMDTEDLTFDSSPIHAQFPELPTTSMDQLLA